MYGLKKDWQTELTLLEERKKERMVKKKKKRRIPFWGLLFFVVLWDKGN